MSDDALEAKYARMGEIIRSMERVIVAFSAGVDSTFVLRVVRDVLGADRVVAVTGNSDSLARAELEDATRLTQDLGVEHVVLQTSELSDEHYAANPANRCYYCKDTLYTEIERFARTRGITYILDGVNADDHDDWRPGITAAREHGVRCPVAEAGLTKADVRTLSERLGLPTFDKPAMPCLASRVPYGQRVTSEKLGVIESCEAFLRELGLRECRVRHHDNLARIEVPAEQIAGLAEPQTRQRVLEHFQKAGFNYVTLDLQGFRSGSMNEVITVKGLRAPSGRH
jgi:uncharacterized protein